MLMEKSMVIYQQIIKRIIQNLQYEEKIVRTYNNLDVEPDKG